MSDSVKRYGHKCALGGFNVNGDGFVEVVLVKGQFVYTVFRVTDQLIAFINDDILPRIKTDARFVRAEKVDDHNLFLTHNEAAERKPEEAVTPFVNTFKGLLANLEVEDPDKFLTLTGAEPKTYGVVTSEPDPFAGVMAVNSPTRARDRE